ncbi:hypothetical protein [Nitrosomonas sp. Nm166]|uniref:hypothetical protein n=1 Tax=Nitrosomonas sp. Nm166 TaxID=1881054 RepID=UPI000B871E18|nr:hypothetical protein [Nitrosomonas sp. Nm166]
MGNFGFTSLGSATDLSDLNSHKYFNDPFDSWPRATDRELEEQRGGFLLPNGVMIDISIEKVVSLNGVQTFASYFQFPDNNFFLLQNGDGNITPDLSGSALASVIQNNLDNQIISTINTINLEISNLQNINLNDGSRIFADHIIMPNIHY